MKNKNFIWSQQYRPSTIEDCILPSDIRASFQGFIKGGDVQNLLLSGQPGIGKTTAARCLIEQMGCESLFINGSDQGRFLDTVRTTIRQFVTSTSMFDNSKPKIVFIDEADNTTTDVQLCLRAASDEYARTSRFIFTANYPNKIIEPIRSRFTEILFDINTDKREVVSQLFRRISHILKTENIEYDKTAVASVCKKYFPDFRKIIDFLQRYAIENNNTIDSGILSKDDIAFKDLVQAMKDKDFRLCRKWVDEHPHVDVYEMYSRFYTEVSTMILPQSVPELVLLCGKFDSETYMAINKNIKLLEFIINVMTTVVWR